MTMLKLILSILLLTLPLSASARDEIVQIAPGVQGRLLMPDTRGAPERGVLMLHGFNDHMDGVGNLQKQLAEALLRRNVASLRFNFSGEGERNNHVVTMTLESRMKEAAAAYRLLKENLHNPRIGVMGWSLGGLTAMKLAGENPDWFGTLVLWSAAEAVSFDNRGPEFSQAVQQALRDGRGTYSDWADITLTDQYITSFIGVNASEGLSAYPGSLLSIRGDQDFLPAHDRKWLSLLPSSPSQKAFHIVGGADHIFNVLEDPRPDYGDRVVRLTVDWFDEQFTLMRRQR